jgi:hypothetical protein
LEYSTNGGGWSPYISGTNIPTAGLTSVDIRTRRTATYCTDASYNTVNWAIEATPVSGTLTKSPDAAGVCQGTAVSATLTPGSGGDGTDELEYSTNGGGWSPYTSGTNIPTAGLTSVDIRTRRTATYCTDASYNTVSWAIEATPVSGTLTKSPDAVGVCQGTAVSATLTPGSGGDGTDELEYSTNGGGWSPYISGTNIPTAGLTSVDIRTRRTATYCTDASYNSVSWTIEATPVSGTLTKSPDAVGVCQGTAVSATLTPGSGGDGTDELEYSTNGGGWSPYISGTNIPTAGLTSVDIRTRRTATYCTDASYNSVSWAVEATPVSGTLTKSPDAVGVCQGTAVSATLTPDSGGDGTDELEYSTNGGGWSPYISGTNIPTAGLTSVDIRTRRTATYCTDASYNTVSWAIEATPVSGTLTKSPDAVGVCQGTAVSATLTPGSGGDGTDELEYSTNGGGWSAYTSGTDIPTAGLTSVDIRTRRTATYCTDASYNSVSWTIEATPVSGTLTKLPNVVGVCEGELVSATLSAGSGGNGVDELEYSINGVDWLTYTSGEEISTFGLSSVQIRTRRTTEYCDPALYNTVSWTVGEELPTPGILTKNPNTEGVCVGTNVKATLTTPGSGGNGVDIIQYRMHNGSNWTNWSTYPSGATIFTTGLTAVEVRTQRTSDYCQNSDYFTVSWIIYSYPEPEISTDDEITYCQSDIFNVEMAVDIADAEAYQWLLNGNIIADAIDESYIASSIGTYSVEVTVNGCEGLSNEITISNFPAINPVITTDDKLLWIEDEEVSVTFAVNISDADAYQWLLNGDPIDEATSDTYTTTEAGIYSVEVTVGSCTEESNALEVVISPVGTLYPVISTDDDLNWCEDTEINVEFTVDIIDGDSYQWLLNGDPITDATDVNFIAQEAGNYTVFVTRNEASGTSNVLTVSVISLPVPEIATEDVTNYCGIDIISTELTVNIADAEAYQWLLNGEPILEANDDSFTATAVGAYSVEVTVNGCSGISNEITISQEPAINPVITTDDILIWTDDQEVSVTFTVDTEDADGYQWLLNGDPIDLATNNYYVATAAGIYSVEVTVGSCTEESNSLEVVVNPANTLYPEISTNDPLSWCEGSEINVEFTVDITDADSYQWLLNGDPIDNAIDLTYLAQSVGSYSVYVTMDEASGTSNVLTISIISLPAPQISTEDALTYCDGDDISIEFTVDIENADLYQWLLNGDPILDATDETYIATSIGNYSVAVTVDGCSGQSNVIEVTSNPVPDPLISTTDNLSYCENEIFSVTFSVDLEGADEYQWLLNGDPIEDANAETYIASQFGSYTIQVTFDGCTGTSIPIEIISIPLPSPIISSEDALTYCEGDEINVTFTVNILDAQAYQWLLDGDFIENANDATFIATEVGVYSVEVTVNGCTGTSNTLEIVQGESLIPIISTDDPTQFCDGDEVLATLSVINLPNADSYQWYRNDEPIENEIGLNYTTTMAGIYWVEVTDGNCSGISNEIEIVINDIPVPLISTTNQLAWCEGDEISVLFEVDIQEAQAYQWLFDGEPIEDATESTYLASAAGVYSVAVTVNGCTGISNDLEIQILPLPVPTISSEDPLDYCEGDEISTTFVVDIEEAEAYQWLLNGEAIPDAISETFTAVLDGVYSLAVTVNGCIGISNELEIFIKPTPEPFVDTEDWPSFCEGDEIIVNFFVDIQDADSYQWLLNGEPIPEANEFTYIATEAGVYSVEVVVDGCAGISNEWLVEVIPNPVPTISTSDQLSWCIGDVISVTFEVDIDDPGALFQWQLNGVTIEDATSSTHTATEIGVYSVSVGLNGCFGVSNDLEIVQGDELFPIISTSDPLSWCGIDDISVTFTVDVSTADSYQWYRNDELIDGQTEITYTAALPGIYWVEVTQGACSGISNQIEVIALEVPNPLISTLDQISWCVGYDISVTFEVDITDAEAYQWLLDGEPIENETGINYTATAVGVYSVIVTVNGCEGISNTIEIIQSDELYPIISTPDPTQLCEGDEVMVTFTVNIPDADSYQWYNNDDPIEDETSGSLTVTEIGTYWVMVTQGTCSGQSNTIEVAINPVPEVTIATDTIYINLDGSYLFDAGEGFALYNWFDGSTEQTLLFIGADWGEATVDVWVDVTNEWGCTFRDSAVVVISPVGVEVTTPWTINLYPNPSSGKFNLVLDGLMASSKIQVSIHSTIGQLIYKKVYQTVGKELRDVINLPDKAKGIYLITINDGKYVVTRRIMIE